MTLPGFRACQMCMGTGGVRIPCAFCRRGDPVHPHVCAECGGAGQVPDDDTVEACAKALNLDMALDTLLGSWQKHYREKAGAALLAYARHTQENQ